MSAVKRSVSFDPDLWDEVVREAGAGPVSPVINDALAYYLRVQRGLAAVAAYEQEYGAFSAEELADADRILDSAGVVDLSAPPVQPAQLPTSKKASSKETASRRRRS